MTAVPSFGMADGPDSNTMTTQPKTQTERLQAFTPYIANNDWQGYVTQEYGGAMPLSELQGFAGMMPESGLLQQASTTPIMSKIKRDQADQRSFYVDPGDYDVTSVFGGKDSVNVPTLFGGEGYYDTLSYMGDQSDPNYGMLRYTPANQQRIDPQTTQQMLGMATAMLSAIPSPVQPFAQAYNVLQDGKIGLGDLVNIAGIGGYDIPGGIGDYASNALGGGEALAAGLGSASGSLLQGDSLQQAALSGLVGYGREGGFNGLTNGLGQNINLPEGLVAAGSAINDFAQPAINAVGQAGSAINDFAQPGINAVGQAGSAINDAAQPIIDPVSDAFSAADDVVSESLPSVNLPNLGGALGLGLSGYALGNSGSGNMPNSPITGNYRQLGQEQLDLSQQALNMSQAANQMNQSGPFGSMTYSGEIGSPDRTLNVSLDPAQQALLDQRTSLMGGMGQIAQSQLGGMSGLAQPFQIEGSPSAPNVTAPEFQNFNFEGQGLTPQQMGQFGQGDYQGASQQAQQAIFDRGMQMIQPQLQRQERDFQNRMAQQGIPVGSEAYNRAYEAEIAIPMREAQNALALDAVQAGNQEQSRLFGLDLATQQQNQAQGQDYFNQSLATRGQQFGEYATGADFNREGGQMGFQNALSLDELANQRRAQGINEQLTQRGTQMSELAQLLSGVQPQMPQFQGTPQYNLPTPDLLGAYGMEISQKNLQDQLAAERAIANRTGMYDLGATLIQNPNVIGDAWEAITGLFK